MQFSYFDRELEVYSDEEGVQKAINGYVLGDNRGKMKHEARRKAAAEKEKAK